MKSYNIAEIKQIPITNFAEIKNGLNAHCPFCGHKNHFYYNKNRNTYKSFSNCCKGGSVIDFIMETRGLYFSAAINWLGDNYSLNKESVNAKYVTRDKLISEAETKRIREEIDLFFNSDLSDEIFFKALRYDNDIKLMHYIYDLKAAGMYNTN
jgi:DNA primase